MLLMMPAQGCTRSQSKVLPVPPAAGGGGIEQDAGDYAGTEAVRFEKQVSILGDVNFVHAFAFVGLVGLNQSDGDRVPSDGFFGGLVENLRGEGAEDAGAAGAVGKGFEQCQRELLVFAAVQLHGIQAGKFDGVAHLLDGVDSRRRRLSGFAEAIFWRSTAAVSGRDVARALGIKDESDGVRARFAGERARRRHS